MESEELEDEVTCEPPWIQVHRSCVSFHKEKFLDWYSARQDCQNKSADLLVVSDFQELVGCFLLLYILSKTACVHYIISDFKELVGSFYSSSATLPLFITVSVIFENWLAALSLFIHPQ